MCVLFLLKILNVVLSHKIHAQTSSLQFLCGSGAWMNFVERVRDFIYAIHIRVRFLFCSKNLAVRKFPDWKSKHHAFHLWSVFVTSNIPFRVLFLCKVFIRIKLLFLRWFETHAYQQWLMYIGFTSLLKISCTAFFLFEGLQVWICQFHFK